MKTKHLYLPLIVIFAAFICSGCNESGNIWAKYGNESFVATIRYESEGCTVCADVTREGESDSVRVEFSSPAALRGAVGKFEKDKYTLHCGDISIPASAAEELLKIPVALAARDAIAFERLSDGDRLLIVAKTDLGRIIFDTESQKPIRAEIGNTVCDVVTFSWK